MSTMTIQDRASEALSWFETAKREGQDEPYFRTKDNTPEWVKDLVREAHGDFLPDDWRYRIIYGALESIADSDNPEDGSADFADLAVDVYTGPRLEWLSSNLRRVGYCDEAASDYGHGVTDIVQMIGWGQYAEAEEVYAAVLNALES